MAIRFKRVQRLCDPTNKEAGKKESVSGDFLSV